MPPAQKHTKIVATIGPATSSAEVIGHLIDAGMNVARFNTKHASPKWHRTHIERVKEAAAEKNIPIGIFLDLQGPEIRVELPNEKSFKVGQGETVIFTDDADLKAKNKVLVPELVLKSVDVGHRIVLEDGAAEFVITRREPRQLHGQASGDCQVNHRKTLNTPGNTLNMPSLTNRDFGFLDAVDPATIDFVGLSFVRAARDIEILRAELEKRNFDAHILSKIENQSAIDHIDEIIAASDAIMVARGDLGVEVPYQQLIYWQKTIIAKCRSALKPVITATEMLESMIEHPRPTRAEVGDVAHAVYDGTDAVMLSGETTMGKYPIKAVATQATITIFNEQHAEPVFEYHPDFDQDSAISMSAISILHNSSIDIQAIICATESGRTARLLSRFHPDLPIFALTRNPKTYQQLTLAYGVHPFLLTKELNKHQSAEQLVEIAKNMELITSHSTVLVVANSSKHISGATNSLTLLQAE